MYEWNPEDAGYLLIYWSTTNSLNTYTTLQCCTTLQREACNMPHTSPEWVFSRCTSKLCISSTTSANSKTCFEYRKKFLVAVTLLLASFMMRFTRSSIDCFGTSKLLNISDTRCRPMRWSSTCIRWYPPGFSVGSQLHGHDTQVDYRCWTSSAQSTFPHHPILYYSASPSQTNVLYAILITKMNAICPALCNLLNLTTPIEIKFLDYYI